MILPFSITTPPRRQRALVTPSGGWPKPRGDPQEHHKTARSWTTTTDGRTVAARSESREVPWSNNSWRRLCFVVCRRALPRACYHQPNIRTQVWSSSLLDDGTYRRVSVFGWTHSCWMWNENKIATHQRDTKDLFNAACCCCVNLRGVFLVLYAWFFFIDNLFILNKLVIMENAKNAADF